MNELELKLTNGEELSEDELWDLIWDYEVERHEGDDNRWTRDITSIVQISNGDYYSINWQKGLTEMQDDFVWEQPVKVRLEKSIRTITVCEWIPIE